MMSQELQFPLSPIRLGVLLSGRGSTLENLLARIRAGQLDAQVVHVHSSRPDARGLQIAAQAGVPTSVCLRREFASVEQFSQQVFSLVEQHQPHLIVMAGYVKLLRIPPRWENRVMNIHPSLIPAFCGKGYYGHRVHEAVLRYGCKLTGCTVHFVDNQYDHGPIVLQRAVPVLEGDTVETLAARVQAAERELYPLAIALFAAGALEVQGRWVHIRQDRAPWVAQLLDSV